MARPKQEHPTPAELEVLHVLWDGGAMTVRQVMEKLEARPDRAYTTVMSLMNVMHDKALLEREPEGRAFIYKPAVTREVTLRGMLGDLLHRAFAGSASLLVSQLLDQANPKEDELAEIRKAIKTYQRDAQREKDGD